MSSNQKTAVALSLAAFLLGCSLYAAARPASILAGQIFPQSNSSLLPASAANHLPDGLWCFAVTLAVGAVWKFTRAREQRAWYVAPLLLGFAYEAAQKARWVSGTFDPLDLVLYALGSLIGIFIIVRLRSCTETNSVYSVSPSS